MKTLVVAVCVCLVAVLTVAAKEPAKETTTASPSTTSPSPSTTEGTTPASDAKKPAKDESVSGKSASGEAAKKPSSTSGNDTVTERPLINAQLRRLPADILRDFPGLCFASTLCRVFQPGEQWNLFPFCGVSTCMETPEGGLIEIVEDCGPLPVPDERCRIINEADRNSTFPECCPVFECQEGVELTYLDPEAPPAPDTPEGEAEAKETSTPSSA